MPSLRSLVGALPAPIRSGFKSMPGVMEVWDWLRRPQGPKPSSGDLRPVVYLPTWARWDVMRQRPQYLLEALARAGHRVYFIDTEHQGRDLVVGNVVVTTDFKATPLPTSWSTPTSHRPG
jgi:hypothetical protein